MTVKRSFHTMPPQVLSPCIVRLTLLFEIGRWIFDDHTLVKPTASSERNQMHLADIGTVVACIR
jgi:hypothetical protein